MKGEGRGGRNHMPVMPMVLNERTCHDNTIKVCKCNAVRIRIRI